MKTRDLTAESKAIAKKAGLLYVTDKSSGFSRIGTLKNFSYKDDKGHKLRQVRHLSRIKSLVIPPAWKNVWICTSPLGHIQVTGYDVRGRKQYRYHPEWNKSRNENKFSKMILFASKLPVIRSRIHRDLRSEGIGRHKIVAAVVKIMEQTLIRIGNDEYAKANQSYGLTTIRNRHVKVQGAKIVFDFKGKSGKQHHVEIEDKFLASIVRRCQELPGQELFGYRDERGRVQNVHSHDVNEYLHKISGEPISAKDFRTWGGTVCAALFLRNQNLPKTQKDLKKILVQTVLHTSETLRNTPTVCRKYYIHPAVFDAFENGHLHRVFKISKKSRTRRSSGLFPGEVFTKRLLESLV